MPEIKTQVTQVPVADFLAAVADPVRRADAVRVCALFERITGLAPAMWGPSIIGFGRYDYRYDSGHSGSMCRIGLSPRKAELVLYVNASLPEQAPHLARLGRHRIGKTCLYLKRLAAGDDPVIEDIARVALAHLAALYPE